MLVADEERLELYGRVRDEAYHLRVLTRQLRNQTKTLASAYYESEQRLEALIDELENPTPKEAQGDTNGTTAQARR